MTSDPTRLLEDPSALAALRDDLVHATEVTVQGLDHAAGLAALQSATASSAATSGSGLSMLTTLGLAAAVAGGVVALWLGLGSGPTPSEPIASAPMMTPAPALEPVQVPTAVPAAPSRAEPVESSEPVEPGEPDKPSEPVESVEAVSPMESSSIAGPSASPTPDDPVTRRKPRASKPAKAVEPPPTADRSVLEEARLVAKARGHLTTAPAKALSLAEQAEKQFPTGQLIEERRAIAIQALAALGRTDEAQRRATVFLAKYGRGAHAAAVRRALGD